MMFRNMMKRAATLAVVGLMGACADMGPAGPRIADDLPLAGAQDLAFEDGRLALRWIEELEESKTAKQTMGVWGGVLELSTPGLRLWVPPFALDEDVELTMTAREGNDVAFDFGPHGTTFNTPVWVSIDLTKVMNGKDLIASLMQCSEPTDGLNASGDLSNMLVAANAKGKKKKGTKKSDNDTNDSNDDSSTGGNDNDTSSDTDQPTSSDPDPASTATTSSTQVTCAFRWFEKVGGLDGIYMDDGGDDVAHALEDFEVWIFMDRWLTFKTDHFSGYALAM